jgi:hypothetical protein
MKVIIHRGTKEIGGSSIEVFNERERILFEIGLPLWCMQNRNYDDHSNLFILNCKLDIGNFKVEILQENMRWSNLQNRRTVQKDIPLWVSS